MPRYWVVAPYLAELPDDWEKVWHFDLQIGVISIGWGILEDASKYDKKRLRTKIGRTLTGESPGNMTRILNMVWNFYHEIKPGDIVISRRGRKIIAAVGTVTKTAYYDPKKSTRVQAQYQFPNFIGVRWHDTPRDKEFDHLVFGMQTLYEISKAKYTELVEPDSTLLPEEDEEGFPEGKEVYRLHRSRERNPKVTEAAKRKRIEQDPLLRCEICGFSFVEAYGQLGQGFAEAHHAVPISQQLGEIETRVEDIALVCSNCHRMLHRCRPWLGMKELGKLMKSRSAA
jgi:hypothetical protein